MTPRPESALLAELRAQRHDTLASLSSALHWSPGRTLTALQDLHHPLADRATDDERAQATAYARRSEAATRGHARKEARIAAFMIERVNCADDALNALYASVASGAVNGTARAYLEASPLTERQAHRFAAILRLIDGKRAERRPGRVLLARYAGVCVRTGRRFPPGTLLRAEPLGYVALQTCGVKVRRRKGGRR